MKWKVCIIFSKNLYRHKRKTPDHSSVTAALNPLVRMEHDGEDEKGEGDKSGDAERV